MIELDAAGESPQGIRVFQYTGQRWEETSAARGLQAPGTVAGCASADFNVDGAADLFLLRWRKPAILYLNQGDGTFRDATKQAGLGGLRGLGYSTLSFDYDRDGLPDLLITSHAPFGEMVHCLVDAEFRTNAATVRLFRNRGAEGFEEVTSQAGLSDSCRGVVQAVAADLDQDGWDDLVLANGSLDGMRVEPRLILRSTSGTKFQRWAYLPELGQPANYIGVSAADIGGDGGPQVYLARNPLFGRQEFVGGLFALIPNGN